MAQQQRTRLDMVLDRPVVMKWRHVGTVVTAVAGAFALVTALNANIFIPGAVDEILPRVEQKLEDQRREVRDLIAVSTGRPSVAQEETNRRILERLARIEAKLEEYRPRD